MSLIECGRSESCKVRNKATRINHQQFPASGCENRHSDARKAKNRNIQEHHEKKRTHSLFIIFSYLNKQIAKLVGNEFERFFLLCLSLSLSLSVHTIARESRSLARTKNNFPENVPHQSRNTSVALPSLITFESKSLNSIRTFCAFLCAPPILPESINDINRAIIVEVDRRRN